MRKVAYHRLSQELRWHLLRLALVTVAMGMGIVADVGRRAITIRPGVWRWELAA